MEPKKNPFNQINTDQGLVIEIAPFTINVRSSISGFLQTFSQLYADYPLKQNEQENFVDFHIQVNKPLGLRHWLKPQVKFYFDGYAPFTPLPLSQAFPSFEWGLNWCIANHAFQYLIIHSAVLEKNGAALILPGNPGAGKSTLCAALANRGWRLLSDEMAIIDLKTQQLIPLVRPVSLKNESIDIIKKFAPDAIFGPSFLDTSKGVVAHMKAPEQSLINAGKRTNARWVVFPRYISGSETSFQSVDKAQTAIELATHSFNYNVLGQQGFDALCGVSAAADCFQLEYSDLDDVISVFNDMADSE